MKVAIVAQPWDRIAVPFRQGSTISIVASNLAAALPPGGETLLLTGRARGQAAREPAAHGIVLLRYSCLGKRFYQALDLATGFFDLDPPFCVSRSYYRSYYRRVGHALAARSPDVVLLFTHFQYAPMLRRRAPHARIVLRMADGRLGSLRPRAPIRTALDSVDVVAGNSSYTTGQIKQNIPEIAAKCHTLFNGVDVNFFKPPVAGAGGGARSILFVGRVSPEKGVHILLEAFDRVLDEHPDCELQIVGKPGLLPYSYLAGLSSDPLDRSLGRFYGRTLMEKFRRQALFGRSSYSSDLRAMLNDRTRARVKFLGPVPYAELPGVYARATVFAMPSVINEPFGNPLAEAMACGLPVVATAGGGFRDLVEHGRSGLLVERGNARQLAAALSRLLRKGEEAERLGRAARARIVERFTWQQTADTLLGLSLGASEESRFVAPARG